MLTGLSATFLITFAKAAAIPVGLVAGLGILKTTADVINAANFLTLSAVDGVVKGMEFASKGVTNIKTKMDKKPVSV